MTKTSLRGDEALPKNRWVTRAAVNFLFYRLPAVHPSAPESIAKISSATQLGVSAAVCTAVLAAWQTVGTAARTALSVSGENI